MNWGLQNGTKVHKVKAKKNLTVMVMTDPTKAGITLRLPKWLRFPLMVLPLLILIGVLATYSHIADLESQLAAERSNAQSSAYTIIKKEATIESLEEKDAKRFDQLEGLATLTVTLKARLSELEAYKEVIDDKLGSTDKTTDTVPTRAATSNRTQKTSSLVKEEAAEVVAEPLEDLIEDEETSTEFAAEVDRLLEEVSEVIEEIDSEETTLEIIEDQVDEILPYWEAYPGVLPLEGTYVTSPYGYRRNPFGSSVEFHSGVDLKATYQDVWATGSGVVTYAGYNSGYGYLVIIDHGYGLVTKYAHNSKLHVAKGDHVERYDVIATSGNSGRSSGPHLHYEILENGETQDPMTYIYEGE